jgi:NhaP-type Na+/H+ or K+/H+ antiporter
MSNTSIPYLAANGATALAISMAADKVAAANTASTIAAYFNAGGTGDFTAMAAQLQTLVAGIKDPAMAQFAANALAFVTPAAQIDWQVVQNSPFLGESLKGWFADTGAGIAAAAGAELAQQKKA